MKERFEPKPNIIGPEHALNIYKSTLKSCGVPDEDIERQAKRIKDPQAIVDAISNIGINQIPANNFAESVAEFHRLNGGEIKG